MARLTLLSGNFVWASKVSEGSLSFWAKSTLKDFFIYIGAAYWILFSAFRGCSSIAWAVEHNLLKFELSLAPLSPSLLDSIIDIHLTISPSMKYGGSHMVYSMFSLCIIEYFVKLLSSSSNIWLFNQDCTRNNHHITASNKLAFSWKVFVCEFFMI